MDDDGRGHAPSAELRAFVFSCIDSVAQVQVLTLLSSAEAQWTTREVAQAAALSDAEARHHLESMAARGLLTVTVTGEYSVWRYQAKSEALRRYSELLVAEYRHAPMNVIRLVASSARPSVRRISDAFRLRERG